MTSGVYPRTDETRKKMSLAQSGNRHRVGKKMSDETKRKLSESKVGRPHLNQRGENSGMWKDGRISDRIYVSWLKNKRNRLKRAAEGKHSFEEWTALKEKYGWMCLCCKRCEPEIKLTQDHIIPVSKGGRDDIENIQPLCNSCNTRKLNKIIDFTLCL
jgi:5-methylcytosine-specific restriction endonuclease McrA